MTLVTPLTSKTRFDSTTELDAACSVRSVLNTTAIGERFRNITHSTKDKSLRPFFP